MRTPSHRPRFQPTHCSLTSGSRTPTTETYHRSTWKRTLTCTLLFVFTLHFSFTQTAHAGIVVPPQLQVAIIYKLLSYDKNLPARSGGSVKLAIIFDRSSETGKDQLIRNFAALRGKSVQGCTLQVMSFQFESKAALSDQIQKHGANLFYVPTGARSETISAVRSFAQSNRMPSLGGSGEFAALGLAVAFQVEDGKPHMVVNLKEVKAQGMELSSRVLRVSTVIP